MDNTAKYLEWIEKVLAYPEHASNFAMRYDLVQHYVGEENYAKAAEYARMTLEAAEQVKQPSADTLKSMRAVQNACHHLIGINQYEAGKYAEAIKSFQQALRAEVYGEGFYYIGMCQRNQDLIDDAMISLAKAELHGGEVAPKAKEYLEKLYKALHNNTLIGIDKVYRKAKEQLEDQNISATVVNSRFVKPLDAELINRLAREIPFILTVEENVLQGGFGSAVLECLADARITASRVVRLGISDTFVQHGSQRVLRSKYGVDTPTIVKTVRDMVHGQHSIAVSGPKGRTPRKDPGLRPADRQALAKGGRY